MRSPYMFRGFSGMILQTNFDTSELTFYISYEFWFDYSLLKEIEVKEFCLLNMWVISYEGYRAVAGNSQTGSVIFFPFCRFELSCRPRIKYLGENLTMDTDIASVTILFWIWSCVCSHAYTTKLIWGATRSNIAWSCRVVWRATRSVTDFKRTDSTRILFRFGASWNNYKTSNKWPKIENNFYE